MTTLPIFSTPPEIRVKKLDPQAVIPSHSTLGDAGYDCVAIDDGTFTDTYVEYRTGIAIELPPGYHACLFPRSSISKYSLVLANSVGLVDNGYRGEIRFRFKCIINPATRDFFYKKGDKVGQIVIQKTYDFAVQEVDKLSDTVRDEGGFGSTGR